MLRIVKTVVAISAIAIVISTAYMLNDVLIGIWTGISVLVGYALAELSRLKK
ncbi:hypothetical protein E0W72_07835 [Flavobacterium arcticum]|nr:hypothetical protein [Flavobacterium arcticum]KAF2510384.1 hypothetical protein E0W72_07835 [Flavobacterium arcticum]